MIELKNKESCCGCTACESICPEGCISMQSDEEGFRYPVVNKRNCINCRLCEKKCPLNGKKGVRASIGLSKEEIIHKAISSTNDLPDSYVCFINNLQVRNNSTSGGIFTAIAEFVIKDAGVIYGVKLDEELRAVHASAQTSADLEPLRRSKYIQSEQSGIFSRIRKDLDTGKRVLYTGTPCQIEGLIAFLGRNYDNLITIDIFCHGVGSPMYWEKYTYYMQTKYKSKIKKVCFREKTYGYNSATMALYFENGKSSHRGHDDDMYWSAYSKNYIYRPSCYECVFKKINHSSDFSIGDFWDTNCLTEEFKAANGCSLVLCHSSKAKSIIKKLTGEIHICPIELETALLINGGHQPSMLITSSSRPKLRDQFIREMKIRTINELFKKYMPLSFSKKVFCCFKPILYQMGILDTIKKFRIGREEQL